MKYKGFEIKAVRSLCADWKIDKHGQVVDRNPNKEDIEWYEILDPMEDNERWICCYTSKQCKEEIDKFLARVNMKDNKQASWDKIGD